MSTNKNCEYFYFFPYFFPSLFYTERVTVETEDYNCESDDNSLNRHSGEKDRNRNCKKMFDIIMANRMLKSQTLILTQVIKSICVKSGTVEI